MGGSAGVQSGIVPRRGTRLPRQSLRVAPHPVEMARHHPGRAVLHRPRMGLLHRQARLSEFRGLPARRRPAAGAVLPVAFPCSFDCRGLGANGDPRLTTRARWDDPDEVKVVIEGPRGGPRIGRQPRGIDRPGCPATRTLPASLRSGNLAHRVRTWTPAASSPGGGPSRGRCGGWGRVRCRVLCAGLRPRCLPRDLDREGRVGVPHVEAAHDDLQAIRVFEGVEIPAGHKKVSSDI